MGIIKVIDTVTLLPRDMIDITIARNSGLARVDAGRDCDMTGTGIGYAMIQPGIGIYATLAHQATKPSRHIHAEPAGAELVNRDQQHQFR